MCIKGNCIASSLAPFSACPYGDELVPKGTLGISDKSETCEDFLSILNKKNISEDEFCASPTDRKRCCNTCLSNDLRYFKKYKIKLQLYF